MLLSGRLRLTLPLVPCHDHLSFSGCILRFLPTAPEAAGYWARMKAKAQVRGREGFSVAAWTWRGCPSAGVRERTG